MAFLGISQSGLECHIVYVVYYGRQTRWRHLDDVRNSYGRNANNIPSVGNKKVIKKH